MRLKEGIKPVDPYDESIRRELCSEKLTVLVIIILLPRDARHPWY